MCAPLADTHIRPLLDVATYPTEFVKTRAQFAVASGSKPPGPIEIVRTTLAENGIRGLYSGCSALVAGNAVKAGVRFLSYDSIKLAVADKEVSREGGEGANAKKRRWLLIVAPCRRGNSPCRDRLQRDSSQVSLKVCSP